MAKIPDHLKLDHLNAAGADAHRWSSYKSAVRSCVIEAMTAAHAADRGINTLLSPIRLLHDTVYVADRIRKAAISNREPVPSNLLDRATDILAKPTHRGLSPRRRSKEEEKFAVGARVNWHKLVRRTSPISAAPPADILPMLRSRVMQSLLPLLEMFEQAAKSHPRLSDEINALKEPLRNCLEKYARKS